MAGLDHRAAEDHRSADESDGVWWQRVGGFRCGDSVDAGLRLFRQADQDPLSLQLIARAFDGEPTGLTRDDVLDNTTLFWLTNTTISAARLYWEGFAKTDLGPKNVSIPVAVSLFPDEVIAAPRSWTERAYPKLIHYNQLDKGGHFAAWEQPTLLVDEMRVGLKPLR